MMRIDAGLKASSPAVSGKRVSQTRGAPFSPTLEITQGRPKPGAGSSLMVSGLNGLLILQAEAADETVVERRKKNIRRAYGLLASLDRLKACLLTGQSTAHDLYVLKTTLSNTRQTSEDSALDDTLAHIDLRARVEIAKRECDLFTTTEQKA